MKSLLRVGSISLFKPFCKPFVPNTSKLEFVRRFAAATTVTTQKNKPKNKPVLKKKNIEIPAFKIKLGDIEVSSNAAKKLKYFKKDRTTRFQAFLPNLVTPIMKQGVVDKGTFKQIAFRVPIKMNKPDIAAYFKQVYGLDVLDVHTVNYEGRKFRPAMAKRGIWAKKNDFKKAYVFVDDSKNPIGFTGSKPGLETVDEKETKKAEKASNSKA